MSLLLAKLSYSTVQLASIDLDLGHPQDVGHDDDDFLSSPMQLGPLSSSCSEHLTTSNHVFKRKNKRGRWNKCSQMGKPLASSHDPNGMSQSSRNQVGDKLLTFTSHVGGTTPTSRHHVVKNHSTSGHHARIGYLMCAFQCGVLQVFLGCITLGVIHLQARV